MKSWRIITLSMVLVLIDSIGDSPSAQGNYYQQLGTTLNIKNANFPSLALDGSGNPVVSWSEADGPSTNIYVKRWNGISWVQLGTSLGSGSNETAKLRDGPSNH